MVMFASTHASVGQIQGRSAAKGRESRVESQNGLFGLGLRPRSSLLVPRSAITLTEVLISLGILAIGLLGVAALFPVGAYYMQKGEVSDNGSAVAQAVFNEVMARGILNP